MVLRDLPIHGCLLNRADNTLITARRVSGNPPSLLPGRSGIAMCLHPSRTPTPAFLSPCPSLSNEKDRRRSPWRLPSPPILRPERTSERISPPWLDGSHPASLRNTPRAIGFDSALPSDNFTTPSPNPSRGSFAFQQAKKRPAAWSSCFHVTSPPSANPGSRFKATARAASHALQDHPPHRGQSR